jgi:glycosyltransferase involved in cell wall biosynthesis
MSLFFPRGKGPLVSVLLPSRGRVGHLAKALDSLWSMASDRGCFEVLVKVDDDDSATIAYLTELNDTHPFIPVRWFCTPRGGGYHDLHVWYNEILAPAATGDWLWFFNDDAVVQTQGWDWQLLHTALVNVWHPITNDVCLLIAETNDNPLSNESILLRRRSYELMGHCFLTPYGDSWLVRVMDMLESVHRLSFIKVRHYRDEIRDTTRFDTDAAFYDGIVSLNSVSAIDARIRDAQVLLEHIKLQWALLRWGPSPMEGGWYFWKPAGYKYHRCVYVKKDGGILMIDSDSSIIAKGLEEMTGEWALLQNNTTGN